MVLEKFKVTILHLNKDWNHWRGLFIFECPERLPIILLKFEKRHGICLSDYSSAVYGPTGAKLGRDVREGHEKHLAKTEFENSNRLPWKLQNSVTAKIFIRLCWIFHGPSNSLIVICLQNMSKIHHTVLEIGPPDYIDVIVQLNDKRPSREYRLQSCVTFGCMTVVMWCLFVMQCQRDCYG